MKLQVEPISEGPVFFLAMVTMVAGSVYIRPNYLVKSGAPYWLLALCGMVAVAALWAYVQVRIGNLQSALVLESQMPTYAAMLQAVWGTLGFWVVGPIAFIAIIVSDCIELWLFGSLPHTFFSPATPRYMLGLTMLLPAVGLAARRLHMVARVLQFWFPLVLRSVGCIVVGAVAHLDRLYFITPRLLIRNMMPVQSMLGIWFMFVPESAIQTVVAYIRNGSHLGRTSVLATVTPGMILLLLDILVVGTLGPAPTSWGEWPIVYGFSLVTIRSFFLQGAGLFILIAWTNAMTLVLLVHLHAMSWNGDSVILTSGARRWMVLGAQASVIGVGALALPTPIAGYRWLFGVISPVSMVLSISTTGALCGLSLWRARKQAQA